VDAEAYTEDRKRIEESLHQSEEQLLEAVGDLKRSAQEVLTPGDVIARRPYLWLGAALMIGFWIGRRAD
jgi:hypothetical protein